MKSKYILIMLLAGFLCTEAQTWTWSGDNLPYARDGLSAAVLDDSIFYSGGRIVDGFFWHIINIYDISEDEWDPYDPQSPGRWHTSAVSANGMVFIAGGNDFIEGNPFDWYADIDVFNKASGEWTVKYLSEARIFMGMGTVAHENMIFFAGGLSYSESYQLHDDVDIYDTETGIWEDKVYLSVGRWAIGAVAAGGKVFFAGGTIGSNEVTDVVDIYDMETGSWTDIELSEARAFVAAVTYGDRVYFAGGTLPDTTGSDVIDIYNVVDEEWEDPETLSVPRIVFAHKVYDALVFTGWCDYFNLIYGYAGNTIGTVDIYYPETGDWDLSVPPLDPPRHFFAHASYDNKVYYAGGRLDNEGEIIDTINILEYAPPDTTRISEDINSELMFRLHPNPFASSLQVDYNLHHSGIVYISIYNNIGKQVAILMNEYTQQGNQEMIFDTEKLKPGVYFCTLKTNNGIQTKKMIKL